MKHSDTLDKIAPALVKARAKMGPVHKDQENPHFKSAFASLGAITASALPALLDNGIAVIQSGGQADEAGTEILTRLQHVSGEWIETAVRMPLDKPTAQGAGSALTYGRRYGLAAALGIVADEDDDGNAASAKTERKPEAKTGTVTQAPRGGQRGYHGPGPSCPKCGGEMWDNRVGKKNPKAPDYKCKDKSCVDERGYGTALWEKDLMAEVPAGLEDDEPRPWDDE